MLSYVFLGLYLVAAGFNLAGTQKGREKLFKATKPALLMLICLYCITRGLPEPDLLLIGAFAACWLGDVLLMLKGDVWFTLGGISFFAGHALLIAVFARGVDFGRLPLYLLIPAAVLYVAVAAVVMSRSWKNAPAFIRVPMLLYLLCNSVTGLFALTLLAESPGPWTALAFAGAALFFTSDCALFLLRYGGGRPRFYKTDLFVMSTYISAVLLIALGATH